MFNNKSILITGGTGSFGSALVLHILNNFNSDKIIIFSRDEYKQFVMRNLLEKHKNFDKLRFFLGDVRDYERLLLAFNKVDYVIHAAALKYVDVAEYNPTEFVKTNILGTQNVSLAAINSNVKKVMFLSTDKAVNPINLYGSTKLVSEKLIIAANNYSGKDRTKFSVVRYGNVANSRGSVIPKFLELLKKTNIFPLTDKLMTRFFLNVSDSVVFVVNMMSIMKGGEVFIPKCKTIKIIDLARAISPKIKFKIIGIRPGEKLHESLHSKEDTGVLIEFKKFYCLVSKSLTKNVKFFLKNNFGKGKIIKNFDYNSNSCEHLKVKEIKLFLKDSY
jgi:UDP-N-acetylglucosamine 4,6-dehydratase